MAFVVLLLKITTLIR